MKACLKAPLLNGYQGIWYSIATEELYRMRYRSERELKESVRNYIDFYNEQRLHEELGYVAPATYEENFYKKLMLKKSGKEQP